MPEPQHYDLVVIGSGPAGEKGAAQAAYFGKRVALIEKESVLGGAAANTGTLPSKTLRETSLMLSGFRARGLYGVDLSLRRRATVQDFLHRAHAVTQTERERVASNLLRHRIDQYHGHARFLDPHTVRVERVGGEPRLLRGTFFLIATGSSPFHPPLFPFADPRVYDSDSILGLNGMPDSLVTVGGGVIGCEYACILAALGIKVTLVDNRPVLLGFLDRDVSATLKTAMTRLGVQFMSPEHVEACHAEPDSVVLRLSSGKRLKADALFVAAGRVSNTAGLDLEHTGLTQGRRGLLEVDANYCTHVPHIYAAGDVIGFPALASTSMEQARLAMVHAFDLKYKTEVASILPYGIYTIPEVSMAGETEQSLEEKGIEYVSGRASYAQNARGIIIGDKDGFLKLIFAARDMKLLGVHVIGENASEVVHIGLTALMLEATSQVFIRTCYNYPTLGELYKYATYDAMGQRQRRATQATPTLGS